MRQARLLGIVAAGIVLLAWVSVAFAAEARFVARLSGDQEVPAVETQAEGLAVLQLSGDGTELRYMIMVANIENVAQGHIHMGEAGTNGPVVAWLYPSAPPPSPIAGSFSGFLAEGTLSDANLTGPMAGQTINDLMAHIEAGNAYVNLHTAQYPGGEIRGQIK